MTKTHRFRTRHGRKSINNKKTHFKRLSAQGCAIRSSRDLPQKKGRMNSLFMFVQFLENNFSGTQVLCWFYSMCNSNRCGLSLLASWRSATKICDQHFCGPAVFGDDMNTSRSFNAVTGHWLTNRRCYDKVMVKWATSNRLVMNAWV